MNATVLIAVINAAISIVETLVPKLKELFSKGEITVAQQSELMARVEKILKDASSFTGPEWEVKE